jgi:hypothetical protein
MSDLGLDVHQVHGRTDPDADPSNVIVCQTCNIVLNRLSTPDDHDNDTWVHTRTWKKYDHEPIPVSVPRNTVTTADCDFCGRNARLNWTFVGQHVGIVTPTGGNDYGTRWGACDPCAEYIDNGNITGLLRRVMTVSAIARQGTTPAEKTHIAAELNKLWSAFFKEGYQKEYTGPPVEPPRLNPKHMPKYRQGLIKFWNHDKLYDQTTGHGIHKGQSLPAFTVDPDREDDFNYRVRPGEPLPPDAFERFRKHLTVGIKAADLYWISKEFTQLATLAGTEFNKLLITREQLPSPHGFAIYEQPIGEIRRPDGTAGIRAFTWTLIPGGIWVNIYFQIEDAGRIDVAPEHYTHLRQEVGWFLCANPGGGFRFDLPIPAPGHDAEDNFAFINTIFATWMFLTQPGVAEQTIAPADKKLARAYQRSHGQKLPDVILVDLRRRQRRDTDTTHDTGPRGPLQYRRYTRGHWKRQFFGPKRGQRKLIYISPYIAGPDNAPLRATTPTVKVLR